MTPNRTLLAALGLATAAALMLTACSTKSSPSTSSGPTNVPTHSASPTAPPSAADRLAAAIRLLRTDGFDFTLNEGYLGGDVILGGIGSYDMHANAATLDLKGTAFGTKAEIATTEILSGATDHKLWVKVNLGDQNTRYSMPRTKWMSLDPGKLTGSSPLPFDLSGHSDALDIADLMSSVSNVQALGSVGLTGTVDLTKSGGVIAPLSEISGKETQATAVPFAAVLDPQGRLIALTIDTRSFSKEGYRVVGFSNYGSPHAIKPPSPVVAATAKNYEFFNN